MSGRASRGEAGFASFAGPFDAIGTMADISSQVTVGCLAPGRVVASRGVDDATAIRSIGHYQILEKLGAGAAAAVYRVRDTVAGRMLALKLLHPDLCDDDVCRMRFLREGRLASMLSHPNIVKVIDAGEIGHRPYIAMDLIDGAPLSDTLSGECTHPLCDALDIGIQLAAALDHAHTRGIVHCDVKPANVIRVRRSGTIRLTDFGIARIHSTGKADRAHSLPVMGTLHYMSPEQVSGGQVDARSDLWAIGVILYQLLSGQRPFEASSMAALLRGIASGEPIPVAVLRKDLPAGLSRIIARCLEKLPHNRFPSGGTLARALSRVRREIGT